MAETKRLLIGLMSGTSVDGIDSVLIDISGPSLSLVGHHSIDFPQQIRQQILQLCSDGPNEIQRMGVLDRELGLLFGRCCNELLQKYGITADEVRAIGSHGQTIRHQPNLEDNHSFTLQIGDPNTIAEQTSITTVADFRRRDIAAGGEGAPLVPAFHQAIFSSNHNDRAIINIGGMANISILNKEGSYSGFDTGPGNVLMDAWIHKHRQRPFDQNGEWAQSGESDHTLLTNLLAHPFFSSPPPKSTGRETFNLAWLEGHIDTLDHQIGANDVQATLLSLTIESIARATSKYASDCREVYLCGGGAFNHALVEQLAKRLPEHLIANTDTLGIAPQWVEASAFAWLAQQTLKRKPGNAPSVTGASSKVILGGIYYP